MIMDLLSLAIGVAIGAAFSPFWMKVWEWMKALVAAKVSK